MILQYAFDEKAYHVWEKLSAQVHRYVGMVQANSPAAAVFKAKFAYGAKGDYIIKVNKYGKAAA